MLFLVTPRGLKARPDVERAALLRHPWFIALKEEVARYGTGDIYLPISVNNCHWIIGRLDVAKATWSFCDSLSNLPLSSTYYQACLFIAQGLGLNCPIPHSPPSNECFKSGRQSDGHSCAYFALNAIEHDIFDYPLACPRTAKYIRLRTFLLVLQEGTGASPDAPRRRKGYEQLDQFPSDAREVLAVRHQAWTEKIMKERDLRQGAEGMGQPHSLSEDDIAANHNVESAPPSSLPELAQAETRLSSDNDSGDEYYEMDDVSESGSESDKSVRWDSEEELKDYMDIDYSFAVAQAKDKRIAAKRDQTQSEPITASPDSRDPVGTMAVKTLRKRDDTGGAKRHSKFTKKLIDCEKVKESPHLWDRFVLKVKSLVPEAKTDSNLWSRHVWCPNCGDWVPLKAVFQFSCFKKHFAGCRSSQSTASSNVSVKKHFFLLAKPGTQKSNQPGGTVNQFSCPGLTKDFDPRIERYLGCTGADGGGAPNFRRLRESVRQSHPRKRDIKHQLQNSRKGGFYTRADQKREIHLL